MRLITAAFLLVATVSARSLAQTAYDEQGPGRSNMTPSRGTVPRTTNGAPPVVAPTTTTAVGGVRSAPAARTSAMSVNTGPTGGRWVTLRKIYPEGFARMPLTFARIMPLGLPRIPEKVVGRVRSSMALFDSPRRFLTDTPMPADAPLCVLHDRRRFEPDLIRGYIMNQEHDKLAGVGNLAGRERGRASAAKMDDARFDKRYREVMLSNAGLGPAVPNGRIGSGIADPKLRPVVDETFNPGTIGSNTAGAIEQLRVQLKASPDDFHSLRLLGVAQLANREVADAAATMAKAYEADPLLVNEPLDLSALGIDSSRASGLITSATGYASKDAPRAHLLTLVLQQAMGQKDKAKASLDRARKAGLSPELAGLFAEALR